MVICEEIIRIFKSILINSYFVETKINYLKREVLIICIHGHKYVHILVHENVYKIIILSKNLNYILLKRELFNTSMFSIGNPELKLKNILLDLILYHIK